MVNVCPSTPEIFYSSIMKSGRNNGQQKQENRAQLNMKKDLPLWKTKSRGEVADCRRDFLLANGDV